MITQDDVLYMIVTDRFEDGDPNNNGEVDRCDLNRRHGGDLWGIVRRLPYLKELGVTGLWITPVYLNPPDAYHGYHPLDFERVDPHLCSPQLGPPGSREVVRRFVETVHAHEMKVVLDVVVNHTAPGHPWLKERPEWFNTPASTAHEMWLWGLPDLDHDNIDVNDYFIRNVLDWLTYTRVDGVRIDAARHVETEFWHTFKLFAHGLCPDVTLIGEVWDAEVSQVAPYQTWYGFDSMFDFPLYSATVDVFAHDHSFRRIARPELVDHEAYGVLNQDPAYRNAYQLITFLGNHDTPRFFHLAGGADRPEEAIRRARLALTFLMTTRGIPQLYYGDELGMEGGLHPDNRRDMDWSLADPPIGASGAAARAGAMLHFTRDLIHLRRSSMALRYGLLTTLYLTPTVYAFARSSIDEVRVVVLNNGPEDTEVTIPIHANPRLPSLARQALPDGLMLIDALGAGGPAEIVAGSLTVGLPGKTGAIYRDAARG